MAQQTQIRTQVSYAHLNELFLRDEEGAAAEQQLEDGMSRACHCEHCK
jgi:hypothetical protein